jgi:hypothetical protein
MMMTKRLVSLVLAFLVSTTFAFAATLLPMGEQQFTDNNGLPLSGGKIYFYIPNTTTPKATYKNSSQSVSNTNPVTLDSAGRAIIYGSGQYRERVLDTFGNLIWDQVTADTSASSYSWANVSGGTANVQTVSAPNFTATDGQQIGFIAGLSNTGPFSLTPNGGASYNVVKPTASGPNTLGVGDIVSGNQYLATFSAANGNFQLGSVTSQPILASSTIASAATTDLGSIASHNANITGSVNITSFGSAASVASQYYFVSFAGSPLITASAAILTPTGANIQALPNASAFLAYLGAGKWQIVSYTAPAVAQPQVTVIASGSGVYSTATNATYLDIEIVGGGGGGGGSGTTTTGGAGGAGGNTTFGGLTANGGAATPTSGTGAQPSAAAASGGDLNVPGALGQIPSFGSWAPGGVGASSPLGSGGSGVGAFNNGAGVTSGLGSATGYGAGGGGGGPVGVATTNAGWGGNAGAYVRKLVTSPAATYAYSVGTLGTGGTAGTSGTVGGPGSAGVIIVTAHFQ